MKQAFVTKNGVVCREMQEPTVSRNGILVDVACSCISAGTETAMVSSNKKSLVKKVLEDPHNLIPKAMEVFQRKGAKGLMRTVQGATGEKPLGYSAAGIVRQSNSPNFKVGDRVAIAGVGYANHASVASVPTNMAVKIPDGVSFEEASTVAIGCIAMQGVRRLEPLPGETFVVMGLGIMGILAVQMLKARGCRVIGIARNDARCAFVKSLGCDEVINSRSVDQVKQVQLLTNGNGADGVLFTAATHESETMSSCFHMLRRKGRFVLLGVSGMELKREDLYPKELDFRISTSYGPGRYDGSYEERGLDYPLEYVRWTENRNMQEYLRELQAGLVDVKDMISKVYPIDDVHEAYEKLSGPNAPLMLILKYENDHKNEKIVLRESTQRPELNDGIIRYAVIGAGSFVKSMHMPNFESLKDMYRLRAVMSRTSSSASGIAKLYGADYFTTDYQDILNDSQVDLVIITTRHNLHAPMAIQAMKAGKAVFVEKPAAVSLEQLLELKKTSEETGMPFFVGYNRRFSDYARAIREAVAKAGKPVHVLYTMNAGYLPKDHWTHSPQGGGRIVGEGCHIIDTIKYVVGSKVTGFSCEAIRDKDGYYSPHDNVSLTMRFEDGSVGTMLYIAQGSSAYPKETMHIYYDNVEIVLDDYMNLIGKNIKLPSISSAAQQKGHKQELIAMYEALRSGKKGSIPLEDIVETTEITFAVRDTMHLA